jgi:mRNA-degrading endonuclease HigB of HigAB toxin-antitoxin module
MRLLGRQKFPTDAESSQWLAKWGTEIKNAFWQKGEDVLQQFPNATHVGTDSFVFRIGLTGFEMEVSICYLHQIALVNEIRKRV